MSLFGALKVPQDVQGAAQAPSAQFLLDPPNEIHDPACGRVASDMHRLNAGLAY